MKFTHFRSPQYGTLILVLAFFFTGAASAAGASSWADEIKRQIDENVALHFKNQSQVGIIVGVVKGSETHFWSYGEKVRGQGAAPDADTYFEMGSITKTYTATLLALEALKGTLSLGDPISRFWPELDGMDAGKITFQELASHTSGLPRMPTNFIGTDPLDPYKDYDAQLLLEFLKSFKQSQSGPHPYEYSNVGIGLLGYVLSEKIHGQSFSNYLAANLLRPLGLNSTKTNLAQADLSNSAQGYDNFFFPVPFWNLNVLEPAGVLKTTARDLLRYLQFNMITDSSLIGRAMELAHQQLAPAESPGVTVGLVWSGMKLGKYTVLSHGGATGGYRANLGFDKSEGLGAIVLSNTDVVPSCVLSPVFDQPCQIPSYQAVSASLQSKLVGKFVAKSIGLRADVFLQNGFLGIHPEGQPRLRLWAKTDFEYYIPDAKAEISFKPSESGDITGFELKQGGQNYLFERL